jgi:FtsZ-binding cell division protein ZapB
MENAVEDLQEQSERRKKQMQSLVQKQDELMTENYQLKQKVRTATVYITLVADRG